MRASATLHLSGTVASFMSAEPQSEHECTTGFFKISGYLGNQYNLGINMVNTHTNLINCKHSQNYNILFICDQVLFYNAAGFFI